MRNMFLAAMSVALMGSAASAQQPAQTTQPAKPAQAAAAVDWTVGAKISDTSGGAVGTVSKVDGEFVVIRTDKHEVRLPKTSFAAQGDGFVFAMTQAQLNAEVEKTLAEAGKKIAPGATVSGSQGARVGTIEAVDGEFVTLKLASGKLVRLPRTGVAPGPDGAVIGMTAAELEKAADEAAPETPAQEKAD